jgi:LemA protein
MEWLLIVLILLFVAGLFLVPWLVRTYNRLVWGRNKVREFWSNIEVQLNRRHELVPNLVATVKGYATHEDAVFTRVTEARAKAMGASQPGALAQAERELTGALASLYAVAENYPQLKAAGNFSQLQQELVTVEETIQQARTKYNAAVSRFNTAVQSFPVVLVARLLGFKPFDFFDAPDGAGQPAAAVF